MLRVLRLLHIAESTQALAHVASSRIIVYTVSRWDQTQYLMSYSTVQYGAVRYGTVRYRNVRYSTLRYITVRYIILRVRYGTEHYARRTVRYTF